MLTNQKATRKVTLLVKTFNDDGIVNILFLVLGDNFLCVVGIDVTRSLPPSIYHSHSGFDNRLRASDRESCLARLPTCSDLVGISNRFVNNAL